MILISGVDGSGKGETINLLYSWMDPRHISTLAFSAPTDEEAARPYMWRYWRALPPKGKVGIFAGSWYSQPIADRIEGRMRRSELDDRLEDINRFEAMLVNEGALVLKFWFHLSESGQKKRLKALEKDPRTAWRVTKASYDRLKTYDRLQQVAGHVLRVTNTAKAPWIIVEGTDDAYRSLTVGHIVLDAMKRRLAQKDMAQVPVAPPILPAIDGRNVLTELDLTQSLAKKVYADELAKYQARLSELVRDPQFTAGRSLVLVFEGSDAAGKGGSIRRVAAAMDARQYQIVPIAAPTEEERVQPYLWRFWRHLPRTGRAAIFDRSWYGRVLVERIEGFCTEADCCAPMPRSTISNTRWPMQGPSSSSSGCRFPQKNNCVASRSVRTPSSSASRSPTKTGVTGKSGISTCLPCATWSTVPQPAWRPGPWSRQTTRISPGSRC